MRSGTRRSVDPSPAPNRGRPDAGERDSLVAAIVEFLPDMVFVKDAQDLRFVHLNRRAEDLLG